MPKNPHALLRRTRRILAFLSGSLMPVAVTHWLGVRAISVAPEQIALREGLRAGVSVGSVMLVAWYLHAPLMAWAAFAAFWTCLVDPGGLPRVRLGTQIKFGLSGTVITGLLSTASGLGTLCVVPALGACVFVCGLQRMRGAIATQISVLAAIVAVVAVCYPQSPMGGLHLAGMFLSGSVWAMLVCTFAWPVDPYAPQKQACAAIFREQAHMAGRLRSFLLARRPLNSQTRYAAVSAYRRDIRNRIEQARAKIEILSGGLSSSRARASLLPAVEAADRIFVAVMGFEHAVLSGTPSAGAPRAIRLVTATLNRIAREIARTDPRPEKLDRPIDVLRAISGGQADIFAKGARLCADAVADLQTAWRDTPLDRPAPPKAAATATTGRRPLAPPQFIRHATRLTVAVLVTYAISRIFALSYAYWALMAVVVVTQPSASATLPRALERMAGSIAGGILAAIMGVALPLPVILVLIFPLATLTIALRSVNYTACVMFMTQLFVLVTDLVSTTHGWDVALSRATDNIIGSLIGLVACLTVWPEKRAATLPVLLGRAFDANVAYAALAARTEKAGWGEIEQARRKAGTTSTQAEILYQQTCLEGLRRSTYLKSCGDLLFELRQLAGAASVWWLEYAGTPMPASLASAPNAGLDQNGTAPLGAAATDATDMATQAAPAPDTVPQGSTPRNAAEVNRSSSNLEAGADNDPLLASRQERARRYAAFERERADTPTELTPAELATMLTRLRAIEQDLALS
ncbi:FUSC family protein [Acetobacter sp.]|uniref:FUSC family protein n=1 Tax=Acetobacter sp. TaxID=440 RepID=UPI0039E7DC99